MSTSEASPSNGDRVGCLQHHEVDCKRCGVLWARHHLEVESYPDRDRGARGLGVLIILLMLIVLACAGIWFAINGIPKP